MGQDIARAALASDDEPMRPTPDRAPDPAGAELRAAPRFTLLLHCAKLIADGRQYICVLRDAWDTGVKVRLFHPLPQCRVLELEMPDGSRHLLERVWESLDHAGLRFRRPVDVRTMLDERGASRQRRPLRVEIGKPAEVYVHGEVSEARIANISQQGACIECNERLSLREVVRIEADLMPPIYAKVCWREAPRYGVVFEQAFQLDELARFLARFQETAAVGFKRPTA